MKAVLGVPMGLAFSPQREAVGTRDSGKTPLERFYRGAFKVRTVAKLCTAPS